MQLESPSLLLIATAILSPSSTSIAVTHDSQFLSNTAGVITVNPEGVQSTAVAYPWTVVIAGPLIKAVIRRQTTFKKFERCPF